MPVSFSKRCWHWRRKAAFAVSEDLLFPMWILEFTEAPQQGAALRVSEHFDGSKATQAAQEVVRYFAGRSIELLRCSEPVYSHRLAVARFWTPCRCLQPSEEAQLRKSKWFIDLRTECLSALS